MKVVHVVESLAVGGLEQVVVALASWQRRQGHDVSIVCLFHEGELADCARKQAVDVLALGKQPGLDLSAMMALRAQLRAARPQVLHTHNPMAHYYSVGAGLGLPRCRVVSTRHGMGPGHRTGGGMPRLERLYRAALWRTDWAVCVCRAGRDRFIAGGIMPAQHAKVVPNGIDVSRFAAPRELARRRLQHLTGLSGDHPVMVAVGRLSAVKDLATLVRAVQLLPTQDPPWTLVLAGDGEERAVLEQQVSAAGLSEQVRFVGMRSDVHEWLPGADVLVQSSRSEGYSLALVEASAAGVPIVATRVGGNAEIVADGQTGLLVPPDTPQALAQALARLLADAEARAAMGRAGRQWALQHGSVDAMGLAYGELYQSGPAIGLPSAAARARGSGEARP